MHNIDCNLKLELSEVAKIMFFSSGVQIKCEVLADLNITQAQLFTKEKHIKRQGTLNYQSHWPTTTKYANVFGI